MEFSGVLPHDAADPRLVIEARLRDLPFLVMGLVPQRAIEDHGAVGTEEGRDDKGRLSDLSVTIGYTLWRNPDNREDPVNLADLDATTLAAIEDEPPWPRPGWLIEQVNRMRYPQLWDAVRTSWHREQSEFTTLSRQLIDHTNDILMNQFREQLGLQPGPHTSAAWKVAESAVNSAASLDIDGVDVPAMEIDTDPFVYAIGAQLDPAVVTTVVIAREHLGHLRFALATRKPLTQPPNP